MKLNAIPSVHRHLEGSPMAVKIWAGTRRGTMRHPPSRRSRRLSLYGNKSIAQCKLSPRICLWSPRLPHQNVSVEVCVCMPCNRNPCPPQKILSQGFRTWRLISYSEVRFSKLLFLLFNGDKSWRNGERMWFSWKMIFSKLHLRAWWVIMKNCRKTDTYLSTL